MSGDAVETDFVENVDRLSEAYNAGIIRGTCLIEMRCVRVSYCIIGNDVDCSAAVEFRHVLIELISKADYRAAAVR